MKERFKITITDKEKGTKDTLHVHNIHQNVKYHTSPAMVLGQMEVIEHIGMGTEVTLSFANPRKVILNKKRKKRKNRGQNGQ